MIWFHHFPPIEFSLVVGTIIGDSLPTVQARPWKEALEPWQKFGGISLIKNKNIKHPPQATWPIESVLYCYPGKRAYGEGELILMEIKLMGDAADHTFFLEVILPALEKASHQIDRSWQKSTSLWGKFDIQNIYVAHGSQWDTLVENSILDLKYTATPHQWSEGLVLEPDSSRDFRQLIWITPFDLRNARGDRPNRCYKNMPDDQVSSLKAILLSFLSRIHSITGRQKDDSFQLWDLISNGSRSSFEEALEDSEHISMTQCNFYPVLESQPGCWIGKQMFDPIPKSILPYLALASIFHIGEYTHFGCGTFIVE